MLWNIERAGRIGTDIIVAARYVISVDKWIFNAHAFLYLLLIDSQILCQNNPHTIVVATIVTKYLFF